MDANHCVREHLASAFVFACVRRACPRVFKLILFRLNVITEPGMTGALPSSCVGGLVAHVKTERREGSKDGTSVNRRRKRKSWKGTDGEREE